MSNSCIGIVSYSKQSSSYIFEVTDEVGQVTGIRLVTSANQVCDSITENIFISLNSKEFELNKVSRFRFKMDFIVGDIFYEVKYDTSLNKYLLKEGVSTETPLSASDLYQKLAHLIYNVEKVK